MKNKSIDDILLAIPNLQQIDSVFHFQIVFVIYNEKLFQLPTNRGLITQSAIDLNEQRNMRINNESNYYLISQLNIFYTKYGFVA